MTLRAEALVGRAVALITVACLPQVVVDTPRRDMVVHGGRVVARDGELAG
ncbi:hypothetical protein HW130_04300 [Streptomyces sp. PKU-EA00015]|nr:hypothetical protein [Streptomyces sp. PKU-EA00015]NWF25492.1 hypothetical protein [Streptomyces sp. PKU-EA00015]